MLVFMTQSRVGKNILRKFRMCRPSAVRSVSQGVHLTLQYNHETGRKGSWKPSAVWLDPEPNRIIRRVNEILLRPQISFRRLHGGVAEQYLDLLQLAASRTAQLRARAP